MTGLEGSLMHSFFGLCAILIGILSLAAPVYAENNEIEWIPYTTDDGTIYLDNDRQPSLYTGSFGDCQGNSIIDVTRFDASLYTDNMTVMIHVEGTTRMPTQSVMMLISVWAYGENRLDMMINPCTIDTPTLCPMKPNVPIIANGMLPIGVENLVDVPEIAYSIPDFEGQAILRIFSNTTRSQAACYAAVMTNGNSFSHPGIVGSVLGLFTIIAIVASVAVAVYGQLVPETRIHYAHSISIFVVFSVFQHIFFSGALSLNWPSVLVAFWSNYAWAAGMLYTEAMQRSIYKFVGGNFGNITMMGAAPSNTTFSSPGWTYDISQLYRKEDLPNVSTRQASQGVGHLLPRSSVVENKTTGFVWYGDAVGPGLPLPGNYSGFAGTLAELSIPASNAFLTGLLWFLIAILIVSSCLTIMKLVVEVCIARTWVRPGSWNFFRQHWRRFTGIAVLRMAYIAFFMMTTLSIFQLALGGAAGPLAIAAIVLITFLIGLSGAAGYVLWYRLHSEQINKTADQLHVVVKKRGFGFQRGSTCQQTDRSQIICSIPWIKFSFEDPQNRTHVHEDADFILKFGWFASRYRRSRWWMFSLWLLYELVRACFYGGAVGNPIAQIIGLLVWEILAFVVVVVMKPYESNRLNLVMVYMLGFSKVITVALSLAFESRFALGRILATAVGIIIIIVQGVLTVCLLVAITLGAISSYMSIMRVRDDSEFRPRRWVEYRARYFQHIKQKATDQPIAALEPEPEPEKPKEPQFAVTTIRREPKIEDQEKRMCDVSTVITQTSVDQDSIVSPYMSRPVSIRSFSSNAPFGARHSRATWSTRDLSNIEQERMPRGLQPRVSFESLNAATARPRSASLRGPRVRPWSMSSMDFDVRAKRRSTMSMTHWRRSMLAVTSTYDREANSGAYTHQNRTEAATDEDYQSDSVSLVESESWNPADWSPDDILPQHLP